MNIYLKILLFYFFIFIIALGNILSQGNNKYDNIKQIVLLTKLPGYSRSTTYLKARFRLYNEDEKLFPKMIMPK
jgi:hypothetical protein